ncbi:MAG: signal peptidase I [Clostridiaceae bacterium]
MSENDKKSIGYFLKEWVAPVLTALLLAWLINTFVVFRIEVPTGSMIPTIMVDDKIFVLKVYNKDNFKRGDILVFKSLEENGLLLIKRLIGLPGDTVELKTGVLYINGELIEEPYVVNTSDYSGKFVVPEDHLFFLGDNRATSKDARYWENPYISENEVLGRAGLRIYPFDNIGFLN